MVINHTGYLRQIFSNPDEFRKTVNGLVDFIEDRELEFSHIACRGMSGVTIAAPLAYALHKSLIVVRKTKADSHAEQLVEGVPVHHPFSYLIVDDFIVSGNTVRTIVDEITYKNSQASLVGVITYNHHIGFDTWDSIREWLL